MKQHRIAELAKRSLELAFTSLSHLIDLEWLLEAFRRTRKDGAVGVDGQTAADYEANLIPNLQSLLIRIHSGTYRAPPVRRVQIPKPGSSETRPIGIPSFEDKLLQRAVLMLLEPIYEQDFYDCSYGFRPGRSTHQAIDATWKHTMDVKGGLVLDRLRPGVGSHDQDRIPEVDVPPERVRQPAFLHHLEQHVKHVGMGLLELVQQDHGIRTPPDLLR